MKFSLVFILLCFFLLIQTQQFASVEAVKLPAKLPFQRHVLAPALYVFGDSLFDSGNNNYLQTLAKVNYTPYGVDFRNGATGRFNNGKTAVDFIASWLGLPYVPPYLGLSEKQRRITKTGINYASGAAGILQESGTGDNLSLEEQVNYFTKTVKNDLPKIFKTHKKISKYLSKSIFAVSIGSNDYINNYLQPALYNSSKIYNPQQYSDLLVFNLKKHLTSLYKLGARKFVVFALGPIGCTPAIVSSATPKTNTPCVENVNSVVKIFNFGVTKMTQELTSTLKGSIFIYADVFKKSYQQNLHPSRYGFSGGNTPCCAVGASTLCLPNQKPCANRNAHLYWDAFHPVQRFSSATQGLSLASNNKPVPAVYVFGDSLVDSGNNNYLQTVAKVNYKPYGVDFPNGAATGRFTNGYTVVDFLAKWLGLPYVPPYMGLSEEEKSKTTTGINYASGAAGILPESGAATGDILSLEEQINYFLQTVKNDLPKSFSAQEEISSYLSKSIFVVSIGSNDYINNYLQPANYKSSRTYTPQDYGALLISSLKQHLTSLYNLGARKFLVFELGPIGCLPAIINAVNPKPTTPCLESVNLLIKIFNSGIPSMIQELTSTLKGSTFVYGDIFDKSYQQNISPLTYGFSEGNTPCCVVGGNGTTLCLPNQMPCENRNNHLYWDAFHPVQRVNYEVANGCFRGSSTCFPINVGQLAGI
ncbi:hypothetical protein MKW92_013534 [Papaver armeniacum]|nr:hypothetical protein MKW92_013534 [Papaver armeniacum]